MLTGWNSWGIRGSRGAEASARQPVLASTRSTAGPLRVRAESPSVTRKRAFLNHAQSFTHRHAQLQCLSRDNTEASFSAWASWCALRSLPAGISVNRRVLHGLVRYDTGPGLTNLEGLSLADRKSSDRRWPPARQAQGCRRAMAKREVPFRSLSSRAFRFSMAKPSRSTREAGHGGRVR